MDLAEFDDDEGIHNRLTGLSRLWVSSGLERSGDLTLRKEKGAVRSRPAGQDLTELELGEDSGLSELNGFWKFKIATHHK